MARQYGFIDSDEEEKIGGNAGDDEKPGKAMREEAARSNSDRTLQMHDETEGGFRND